MVLNLISRQGTSILRPTKRSRTGQHTATVVYLLSACNCDTIGENRAVLGTVIQLRSYLVTAFVTGLVGSSIRAAGDWLHQPASSKLDRRSLSVTDPCWICVSTCMVTDSASVKSNHCSLSVAKFLQHWDLLGQARK